MSRALQAVRAAVTVLLAAAALGILTVAVVLPMIVGGAARAVRTGSMAPSIPAGSLVIDRPAAPASLRVGDIATYRADLGGVEVEVTHRVVAIDRSVVPATVWFRGDANRSDDPTAVPITAVSGRVWFSLPQLGALQQQLSHVRTLTLVLASTLLGATAWRLLSSRRSSTREGV